MSNTPAHSASLPSTLGDVPLITAAELRARYDVLLLDAYGVLVNADGALPGAVAFIDGLNQSDHPYYILTNDASRLPATCAARYNALGVPIPAERVITSGSLIAGYFRQHDLHTTNHLSASTLPEKREHKANKTRQTAAFPGKPGDLRETYR